MENELTGYSVDHTKTSIAIKPRIKTSKVIVYIEG